MELTAAIKIIRALHLGQCPDTEEPLPEGSICLRQDVKEALADAANRLGREQSLPPNQGKPWSPSEDAQLAQEFEQSLPEREMARIHGRSQWAITRRLERLGKIPASEPTLQRAS